MNKKFTAIVIAAIMIVGLIPALATVPIVKAQALPTCATFGAPFCVFLHPGISDTFKPGWSHTLDTFWGSQVPAVQQREVFDHYLDYAILASSSDSVGDLQFDFTIPAGTTVGHIDIYVPPEFKWLGPSKEESIWTDITNDYQFIWTSHRNLYDPIAPDWTRVRIGQDEWWGNDMTIVAGTYHVRLFNLAAPSAAGLYHFKIRTDAGDIGVGNYPIMIVKTELNPAYIFLTVRADLNVAPPYVSGKVVADGTTPDGRAVSGVAYWPSTTDQLMAPSFVPGEVGEIYYTVLFGLAAGTYTLTVTASGYDPTVSDRITLSPGQSFAYNLVIYTSPVVAVTIWSKHGTGAIPWHNLWQMPYGTNDPSIPPDPAGPWRDMMIELYDSNQALVGFWASNMFGTHQALYHPAPAPFVGLATKSMSPSNELIGMHDMGACPPTSTFYTATLVDNFDILGNPRGNPSTHWDGHVPASTADYVAGMSAGQYTVEAFVTGYIMDEADAYQRSFILGNVGLSLQMDLRRSNWIEVTMHVPNIVPILPSDTTVTLTAEDAAGSERAAAAFIATPLMLAIPGDRVLDGVDASTASIYKAVGWVPYDGGIVLEGWNAVFPNVGARPAARNINHKDYGLNPTPSTHSAGQVTLAGNPYTVKLYMSNMGVPYTMYIDPVTLLPTTGAGLGWFSIVGGDPQVSVFLCNSPVFLSFQIQNAFVIIQLRSVDFEVPAHSRPWTFPGSEIWVEFLDSGGNAVDWLDPTVYGLVQDAGTTNPVSFVPPTSFPIVGALPISNGVTPYDSDNQHPAGLHEQLLVRYAGTDYCTATIGGGLPIYRALIDARSTRLPPGEYTFNVYTHGYVMRRTFPFQIPSAGEADIAADMIQGGQIRVIMKFLDEGFATAFNGFVRMEVFNSDNTLVGASVYGQAEPNLFTAAGGGGSYLPYVGPIDWMNVPGPAQAAGFGVPYAPPVPPPFGYPSSSNPQRAMYSQMFYGVPAVTWAGYSATTPADANRLLVPAGQAQAFDVYGFYWYHGGPARTWAGGWPTVNTFPSEGGYNGVSAYTGIQWDYGLKGTVDVPNWSGSGGGLYTVKVWAFDPYGPDGVFGTHDDWRMYYMAWDLTNIQVPWGGATSYFLNMNNMASLRGTIRWLDMYGNSRPLPWAQISATPGPTSDSIPAYSSGLGATGAGPTDPSGAFIMWLPAGSHEVSVSTSEAPGIWSSAAPTSNAEYSVVVTDGWVGGGDTQLSGSGTPVPEVPAFAAPLALFAVLAASVWLLRKKSNNIPVLMK